MYENSEREWEAISMFAIQRPPSQYVMENSTVCNRLMYEWKLFWVFFTRVNLSDPKDAFYLYMFEKYYGNGSYSYDGYDDHWSVEFCPDISIKFENTFFI